MLVPSWFEDQNHNGCEDEKEEEEDALPPPCISLIALGYLELFDGPFHRICGPFDVVLHAVENCALLNDQGGQILEQICQTGNILCNFGQLPSTCLRLDVQLLLLLLLGLHL